MGDVSDAEQDFFPRFSPSRQPDFSSRAQRAAIISPRTELLPAQPWRSYYLITQHYSRHGTTWDKVPHLEMFRAPMTPCMKALSGHFANMITRNLSLLIEQTQDVATVRVKPNRPLNSLFESQ